jgi:small subunit ribosomal protein S6e
LKIVYSDPKSGRSKQIELDKDRSALFLNYKIGDAIDGNLIGMPGCKLKITGGSDRSGFPMERSIQGTIKTNVLRLLSSSGRTKGVFERRTVRGNTVSQDIELLNAVITDHGTADLDALFPKSEKKKEGGAEASEKPAKAKPA